MILKLLTLSSIVGLAAAENCNDIFSCTDVLQADNGGGASAQTVSKQICIVEHNVDIHIYFF